MSGEPDPRRPAWVERVAASLDGQPTTRLVVILRAIGCAYARRPQGGCSNCGFQTLTTSGRPVAADDLVAQLDAALAAPGVLDGVGELDLYNSGSFLADAEIPPPAREAMIARLGGLPLRRLLIESRPEHVRRDKLAPLLPLLGGLELEVGIGLESADDHVREVLVGKGFGRPDFEAAVAVLGRLGLRLLTYVLLKPPGLDEQRAVGDAVATTRYLFDLAARLEVRARVALEPTFVVGGTPLEAELLAGRYRPPSLWSVVETVRSCHPLGEILVGLSAEGLEPRLAPSGCPRCTGRLRRALLAYNQRRDPATLDGLECPCRLGYY